MCMRPFLFACECYRNAASNTHTHDPNHVSLFPSFPLIQAKWTPTLLQVAAWVSLYVTRSESRSFPTVSHIALFPPLTKFLYYFYAWKWRDASPVLSLVTSRLAVDVSGGGGGGVAALYRGAWRPECDIDRTREKRASLDGGQASRAPALHSVTSVCDRRALQEGSSYWRYDGRPNAADFDSLSIWSGLHLLQALSDRRGPVKRGKAHLELQLLSLVSDILSFYLCETLLIIHKCIVYEFVAISVRRRDIHAHSQLFQCNDMKHVYKSGTSHWIIIYEIITYSSEMFVKIRNKTAFTCYIF